MNAKEVLEDLRTKVQTMMDDTDWHKLCSSPEMVFELIQIKGELWRAEKKLSKVLGILENGTHSSEEAGRELRTKLQDQVDECPSTGHLPEYPERCG